MEIVCSFCDACFQVEEGTNSVICPVCGRKVPMGTDDWWIVYQEEIHKPILKKGGGEKADRTHSRLRALKRKLARERMRFRYWGD